MSEEETECDETPGALMLRHCSEVLAKVLARNPGGGILHRWSNVEINTRVWRRMVLVSSPYHCVLCFSTFIDDVRIVFTRETAKQKTKRSPLECSRKTCRFIRRLQTDRAWSYKEFSISYLKHVISSILFYAGEIVHTRIQQKECLFNIFLIPCNVSLVLL
jgi:hypothetical protein